MPIENLTGRPNLLKISPRRKDFVSVVAAFCILAFGETIAYTEIW